MKIRTGTDIIEIQRVKNAIEDTDGRLCERVYTFAEVEYCESKKNQKYQHYAARFAAKEAVFKAISKTLNNQESKPKGIIIKGPEGTRKTFMAKVFIGEAQMPYMIISGGEVRSATDIKKIFSVARLKKSCII